jgi:predicted transcriptional regulator
MDEIEVLMRLHEATEPMTARDLARVARLGPATVDKATGDLVTLGLVEHDQSTGTFRFAARATERPTVDAIADLYLHRPVTLVKLVYSEAPTPPQSFADAFRVMKPKEDE